MQNFKSFSILVNLNFIINTSYVWNGLNTLKLWVENLQICETKPGSLWSSQELGRTLLDWNLDKQTFCPKLNPDHFTWNVYEQL